MNAARSRWRRGIGRAAGAAFSLAAALGCAGAPVWAQTGTQTGAKASRPARAAPREASALKPLPDPPRSSRSGGPYPEWLAGPDGPILPPQTFQPRGLAPSGVAGPSSLEGGPCKVPTTPICARDKETYRGEASRKACEALVSKHVQEVFAYRECLDTEATRATRAVNEAIRLLKCRKPSLKGCD
jgi:hypothetical protein